MTESQHFETVVKVRDGTHITEKNSPDTAEPVTAVYMHLGLKKDRSEEIRKCHPTA